MQVQEDKPYDEINITPMLDLSYVLLVIFIIMCTASSHDFKVHLATASASQSKEPPKTKAIVISNEGQIYLDGSHVTLSELETRLRTLKARNHDLPVAVGGDSRSNFQLVMDVIEVLKRVGITQIGMTTKPRGS